MYLQLYQIKKHLNINTDFHDDDEYLVDLATVAQTVVEKHIDTPLKQLENEEGEIPSPLVHAMLLFIGNMYANRESVAFASVQVLPHAYDYLIALYKNYDGGRKHHHHKCKKEEVEDDSGQT